MLTITQTGLAAIRQADQGGFKISLDTFKLSQEDVSNRTNTDFINATDMVGQAVYTSKISMIEALGTSTVKLTLHIPKEVPRSGSWMFREIGIYLDSGELFATGALEPAYEKNNEYGIKIRVSCTANRLGEVTVITNTDTNSVPAIPLLRTLPAPIDTEHNVVAILDAVKCHYADSYTAALAVRSGPGMLHWSFVGHNRIYHGLIDNVITQSTFELSPDTGGFWLNDDEIVIWQVTTGSGSGQSRKMRYDATLERFSTVDIEFQNLDETSVIAMWRDNSQQLPTRTPDIPYYMMLSHGLNSWQRVDNAPTTFTSFEARTASSFLNSDSQFGSQILEPNDPGNNVIFVWCDGKLIPESQYLMGWNILTVYGKPYGTKVDVLILKRVNSTVGGVLNAFEAKHTSDGQTTRYYFSVVPKSRDWVQVYVGNELRHQSEYDYYDTNIVLHETPAEGVEVLIVILGTYDDAQGSCNVYRTFRQVVPGDTTITYAEPVSNKAQVLMFVDGKQYTHADFQLLPNGLQLITPPTFPGGSSFVDLILFIPTTSLENPDQPSSVSGTNTGPQWADPAGIEGPPNRLLPKVVSRISDGANTVIQGFEVINEDYVLVFADNKFMQDSEYTYVNGTVVLNSPVPAGQLIDVIFFTEVTIDEGFTVECTSFNFLSSTDTTYQLAPVSDADWVIVTVGGKYQHKTTYTIDPTSRIFFQGIEPNKSVEVWYFNVVPHVGWRTTMRRDKFGGNSSNSYPMSQLVSRKENVLTFVTTDKYDVSQYNINSAGDRITLNPNVTGNVPVVAVSFVSGPPKTRLLTRAEYNRSVVSFNFRTGAILLTREDVTAVLTRDDILNLLTPEERAILAGQGGGGNNGGGGTTAEPGNVFASTYWTVPAGVYRIRAVIIAGGGQGGGGSNDLSYAGHGGQRGQVLVQEFDVTPGQQFEVRLGVGGSSYLYTQDGTVVYPQPGDYGTTDGVRGYNGRNGENTIFHQWVALGGQGGVSEPAYAPMYVHADSDGEGQVPITGSGAYQGGGPKGASGVQTPNNNVMGYSYPGTNGALGWTVTDSTGGGYPATSPGAGGGGAAADPNGVGAFGGAGANGIVYISWGF